MSGRWTEKEWEDSIFNQCLLQPQFSLDLNINNNQGLWIQLKLLLITAQYNLLNNILNKWYKDNNMHQLSIYGELEQSMLDASLQTNWIKNCEKRQDVQRITHLIQ